MKADEQAKDRLQQSLGYEFQNLDLLEEALTHSSLRQESSLKPCNERLEFLGDRVLNLLVAEYLMITHPHADEGELSKRLHILVNKKTCAMVARQIDLGAGLQLPKSEAKRGARDQDSLLADAMEAVLAALYLEMGLERLREVFRNLWTPAFADLHLTGFLNPKSQLQEWAAAQKLKPPTYEIQSRTGPDHAPTFAIQVTIESCGEGLGQGSSRQEAEKAAALDFLRQKGLI